MKTAPAKHRVRCHTDRPLIVRAVETEGLPPGVCGRVTLIGLRYNSPDTYGTIFVPGCLARTVAEKVASGRVKFYADHIYRTTQHIGVVRSVNDVADDVLVGADVFDTDSGRDYLEYAKACLATKAQTGCSIGFYDRASEMRTIDGETYLAFTEVELEEFSATPNNAVDGADLLSARHQPQRREVLLTALDGLLAALPEVDVRARVEERFKKGEVSPAGVPGVPNGNATATPDSASQATRNAETGDSRPTREDAKPPVASMDDRLKAVRQSFALR